MPDETPPKESLSVELGHVLENAVEAAVDAAVAETQLAEATTAIPLVKKKRERG